MKNVSGKKFLECYKDQNEWQHYRATTNICWPSFLAEKAEGHKNGITFQAIKLEGLILTKNVSGKKFLECYKNQNELQHHGIIKNIFRPWFLAGKAESEKHINVDCVS